MDVSKKVRKHHNKNAYVSTKKGQRENEVKKMAQKLGIKYGIKREESLDIMKGEICT
jgi:hypothetical protein